MLASMASSQSLGMSRARSALPRKFERSRAARSSKPCYYKQAPYVQPRQTATPSTSAREPNEASTLCDSLAPACTAWRRLRVAGAVLVATCAGFFAARSPAHAQQSPPVIQRLASATVQSTTTTPAAARATAAWDQHAAARAQAQPVAEIAESEPAVDAADTAWVLTSTVLVLMMTLPGLALFYAGLCRATSVNSMLLYHLATAALVSLIWLAFGYSVAFSTTGMVEGEVGVRSVLGSFDKSFLTGVTEGSVVETIPELLWVMFQMTFAIITPCIMIGAVAERMKFGASLVLTALWVSLVYVPIAHAVWSGPGSLLGDLGALDFAGGLVVHISSGFSGLVAAMMLGKRKRPTLGTHNVPMVFTGVSMLWLGWMGFNVGSALSAGSAAAAAMVATQGATAAAVLAWLGLDWLDGKPSVVGASCGALAGLVAITPAAGFVSPMGAIITGALGAVGCRFAIETVKKMFKYDDALDAFGVHGFGGFVGNIIVGIFAHPYFGGNQVGIALATQVAVQTFSGFAVAAFSMVMTFIVFKVTAALCGGCRIEDAKESRGVDVELLETEAYPAVA